MTTTNFEDWEREKLKDPAFRTAVEAQEPEYQRGLCEMYRKRIAALEAEVARLQEERDTAWAEVSRMRGTLRAIVPESKCDGVDLPGVVGTEVARLRRLCRSALFCIEGLDQNKFRDQATYQTWVPTTCQGLRAVLEPTP